jgi:hypothetical protein
VRVLALLVGVRRQSRCDLSGLRRCFSFASAPYRSLRVAPASAIWSGEGAKRSTDAFIRFCLLCRWLPRCFILWGRSLPALFSRADTHKGMAEQSASSEYWDPHHNDLCDGGVAVAEFRTEEDCKFAAYRLSGQGIRSGISLPELRLDLRWPQVRVSPDDELLARQILAQPPTVAERAEYDAEAEVAPFASPRCPRCSSSEVVLKEVAAGNVWHCDECGNGWIEMPDLPDAG